MFAEVQELNLREVYCSEIGSARTLGLRDVRWRGVAQQSIALRDMRFGRNWELKKSFFFQQGFSKLNFPRDLRGRGMAPFGAETGSRVARSTSFLHNNSKKQK